MHPSATTDNKSPDSRRNAARLQRKCECGGAPDCDCDSAATKKEKKGALHRSAASPDAPPVAPAIVHDVLRTSGRTLDPDTRAFFEARFSRDFGGVRIHTDSRAAESARAVNALAYTVGRHVVFRDNRYQPSTESGRGLLAHELAHTVQQGDAEPPAAGALPITHPADPAEHAADLAAHSVTAGAPSAPAPASSPVVARQIPGQQEREPDPGCTPDKPYRIAPKTGPGSADPAVVPICSSKPLTTPTPLNPLAPDTSGAGTTPTQPEPTPPVTQPNQPAPPVTQPAQPAPPPATTGAQQTPPTEQAAPENYDFSDDPLANYDYPGSIRVRPGPVRTTLIRPRPPVVQPPITDCGSLFEYKMIAQFGGQFGPWDGAAVAKTVAATFQACPLAYVSIAVREKSSGDDPHGEAVERAMNLENDLMNRIGPDKYTPDHYYSGSMSPSTDPNDAEIEVDLQSHGRIISTGNAGGGPVTPTPPAPPTTQISGQVGIGGVQHLYTTPAGPNNALHEWVVQAQAAITKQLHAKNQSGAEKQLFVQAQYSLTTKQWTLAVGGQVAQVFQLSDVLQASFFGQLQFGQNITAGNAQAALAAGAQLQWQPTDWFAVVGQATGGPVAQPGGPDSVDLGFTISIQIMK